MDALSGNRNWATNSSHVLYAVYYSRNNCFRREEPEYTADDHAPTVEQEEAASTMKDYGLAPAFGCLPIRETKVILPENRKDGGWQAVWSQTCRCNLVEKTRRSACERCFREIGARNSGTHEREMKLLLSGVSESEKTYVVPAVTARFYRSIRDFIVAADSYRFDPHAQKRVTLCRPH